VYLILSSFCLLAVLIIVHFVRRFCMSFRGENITKGVDADLIGRSCSLSLFLSLLLRKKRRIYWNPGNQQ